MENVWYTCGLDQAISPMYLQERQATKMLQEEFYTLIAIIYSITQIDNGSTNPNPNPLTLNPTSFRYFDYQMKRQKRVEKLL